MDPLPSHRRKDASRRRPGPCWGLALVFGLALCVLSAASWKVLAKSAAQQSDVFVCYWIVNDREIGVATNFFTAVDELNVVIRHAGGNGRPFNLKIISPSGAVYGTSGIIRGTQAGYTVQLIRNQFEPGGWEAQWWVSGKMLKKKKFVLSRGDLRVSPSNMRSLGTVTIGTNSYGPCYALAANGQEGRSVTTLLKKLDWFEAEVGIADSADPKASGKLIVSGDGKEINRTKVTHGDMLKQIRVPVAGCLSVQLRTVMAPHHGTGGQIVLMGAAFVIKDKPLKGDPVPATP